MYEASTSALNGSSEMQHFEHSDVIEIRDEIVFVSNRDWWLGYART